MFDANAEGGARARRAGKLEQDLAPFAELAKKDPYIKKALTETIAAVQAGQLQEKDASAKNIMAMAQQLKDQDNTTGRTCIQQAGATTRAPPRPDTSIYGPGGTLVGETADPAQAKEVNAKNATYRSLIGTLDKLAAHYQKHGRINPVGAEAGTRDSLVASATVEAKTAFELGVLAGPDMGLIEAAIGGGMGVPGAKSSLYARDPRPSIQSVRDSLKSKWAAGMDARGLPGNKLVEQQLAGGGKTIDQKRARLAELRARQ
jgi:hypothetical protein